MGTDKHGAAQKHTRSIPECLLHIVRENISCMKIDTFARNILLRIKISPTSSREIEEARGPGRDSVPCQHSRMAVRPHMRKYFLHENWHFRAKYFSSHQDFIIFKMWNWGAGGPGRGLDCPRSIPGRPFDLGWENIFCVKIIIFARNISHHIKLRSGRSRDSDDRLPWN